MSDIDPARRRTRPKRSRPRAAARHVSLGALATLVGLAVPQLGDPAVAEAGSCTGWTSRATPPQTIRVLRTRTGKVQTVDFRKYVAKVMASGEWPTRLQEATLQAGAVATKQYAWYYAMRGNHRSGYRAGGQCYDVRDDVIDQLYKGANATPTAKQQRAVSKTWALTLRKKGRFFLTGYRAGTKKRCGADANGWKLFARSVETCARQGWTRQRIQRRYYEPDLAFVWSQTMGPLLKKPKVRLRRGSRLTGDSLIVSWRPFSPRADVVRYKLQRKVGRNAWKDVELSSPTATTARVRLRRGVKVRFRVFARDSKGRRGPWAGTGPRIFSLRGPRGISLSGAEFDPSTGDRTRVRITFSGRGVAYVAPTGPGMGKAKVLINGRHVATVDLAVAAEDDRLVWTRRFSRVRERAITIKPVSSSDRVDFEGLLVHR